MNDKIRYTSNHSRGKTFAVHHQSLICRENFRGHQEVLDCRSHARYTIYAPAAYLYSDYKRQLGRPSLAMRDK